MTSIFTADDTGVTKAAQQPRETVIAKACGETCRASAASMATGAISTAVAELEMKSPTTAVTRNTAASIANGPSEPNRSTIPCAAICVAPVFESAVASGKVPATSTTVFQLTTREIASSLTHRVAII